MTRATFLAGVLGWNSNYNFAEHLSVVFQPLKKLSPASVIDAFGKTTILDHIVL
ncbi:MAG: hypothetical protein QNJ18_08660 [Xenococcaceae cyanobacterium MO_167.B52]|nr:hypothetical protein [Xenococcaceae cyanobacterium MO_167.B52]